MYDSLDDLPFVCRLNLPEGALEVYRDSFNQAWHQAAPGKSRHHVAQTHAWNEVRRYFERDKETGRWVPKAAKLKARVTRTRTAVEPQKHSAR